MCKVTGEQGPVLQSKDALIRHEKMVKALNRELVQRFHDLCKTGLYTLKYHLLDHIVKDIQIFVTLIVSDRSTFEHFIV